MVAARSRNMAIAYSAILLVASLATLAPTATAQVGNITVNNADLKVFDGTAYVTPAASYYLHAGVKVRVEVVANIPNCTGTAADPTGATATVQAVNLLATSDPSGALTRDTGTNTWRGNVDFTVAGNFTGTNGVESTDATDTRSYTVTVAAGCAAGSLPPNSNTRPTAPALPGDTRAPRFLPIATTWTNASDHVNTGTSVVGSNTSVRLDGPVFEETYMGAGATFEVDFSGFGWLNPSGQTRTPIPIPGSGTNITWFAVNDSARSGLPLEDATVRMKLFARDQWGNVGDNGAVSGSTLVVDNTAPLPTTFHSGRSTLNRTSADPRVLGATETVDLNLNWTGAGGDISRAQVRVSVNGGTAYPVANFSGAGVDGFDGLASFQIPDTRLASTLAFTLHPVDNAGNVNTGIAFPFAFPHVTTGYGGLDAAGNRASPTFIAGNLISSVFVNVSGATLPATSDPGWNWPTADPGHLFGQMVRYDSAGARTYWNPTQSGNSAAHYGPETLTPGSGTTIWRPGTGYAGGQNVVFTNLTGKNFLDGIYAIAISANDTSLNKSTYFLRLRVDANDPDLLNHRNYSAPHHGSVGASTNMTQVHGMDGNPFRVVVNATDWHPEAGTESGIRNVTVQLVDPAGQVVRRTGNPNSFAQLDLRQSSCVDPGATPSSFALPYCFNLTSFPAVWDPSVFASGGRCGPSPPWTPHCWAYRNVTPWLVDPAPYGNLTQTFVNHTQFSGWVNLTFPDLPAGNYSVRVLAYDHSGRESVRTYQTSVNDHYQVAPAVKLIASTNSPLVRADNKLDVLVGASQRFFLPPAEIASRCIVGPGSTRQDLCPASQVRIYVSNADTAGTTGTLYQTRSFASTVRTGEWFKGFTGAYTGSYTGELTFRDPAIDPNQGVQVPLFEYTHDSIEALPVLPSGIDLSQPVFVRAEAVALRPDGSEIVKRTTDWVRAVTANTPSLVVNQPPVEWALNLTTDPVTGAQVKPPYNVSFDRKAESPVPKMRYEIAQWPSAGAVPGTPMTTIIECPDLPPALAGNGQNARHLFNWTGTLTQTCAAAGAQLAPGAYAMKISVYDGLWASGPTPLATTWRNFTILGAKPSLVFDTLQAGNPGIVDKDPGVNTDWVTSSTFDVTFTVNQGETNLTSLDQLKFRLKRNADNTITENGQNGFSVQVRAAPLDPSLATSQFTATVTLPPNAPNGNRFQLNATAELDVFPWRIGNASGFLDFVLDKQPPAGSLIVAATEASVSAGGTPPKNKAGAALQPAFAGASEDHGAGVSKVEVRIVDVTAGETLSFIPTGTGIVRVAGTDADYWMNSSDIAVGGTTTQYVKLSGAGATRTWTVPLRDRAPLPVLYDPASDSNVINLSHTFRVDVRVTDGLGQVSGINSTLIDLDPHAPHLGYKNQLGVSITTPSGIVTTPASKSTISWQGAGGDSINMTVKVTDNDCIKEVRLVGNSSKNPDVVVKARMVPYQLASGTTYTVGNPTKVCPNGEPVGYYLELGGATNIATGGHLLSDVGNYTFWFEAEDYAGQVSEVEPNHRIRKIEVLDNSPAVVQRIVVDPPIGQAGGRALIRAQIFDNLQVERVTLEARDHISNVRLALINMTAENVTADGNGWYLADTTDDLGIALDIGEYMFNVTAYDVNWNRTNSPTCLFICQPSFHLYVVRDDGIPSVVLESPSAGATVATEPTIKFRALHKSLQTSQITVRASTDGNETNLTAVPADQLNFTELKSTNGTRQGWTVTYTPDALADNTTLIVNVSVALASLVDAKQYTFLVDALPPTVSANVTETQVIANRTYAVGSTRVALVANDTVSTPTIRYSVNGGAEQTYAGEIAPGGQDGEWRLEYWATDPAGNAAPKQTLTLNLDNTGPRITVAKHGDDLLLTVTDAGVGLNESTVTVHYRYGAAASFTTKKADKLTGNSFGTTLPGNATEDGLAYYFTAQDLLGNAGSNYSAAQPYTIRKENVTPTNLPPTIRITAPTAGTSVRNSVELRWLAEDPEEAPLTITIALRDPAPGRVLVPAGENSGSYTINTTGFAAGAYTVVVTANDGENSASAQVTFTVESGEVVQVRNVPPATVLPNTQVAVAVALSPVGKTVAQASYRLMKDGQLVASGLLTPQQGLYAAGFTPTDSGNYSVTVEVTYTDGTTEPAKQVATFRVPGQAAPPVDPETRPAFPVSLMALVAIAVLTIALASYGAFGRWKK